MTCPYCKSHHLGYASPWNVRLFRELSQKCVRVCRDCDSRWEVPSRRFKRFSLTRMLLFPLAMMVVAVLLHLLDQTTAQNGALSKQLSQNVMTKAKSGFIQDMAKSKMGTMSASQKAALKRKFAKGGIAALMARER